MSRASSGRSSCTGLGKSATTPPFFCAGGAASFGGTGSGARGGVGGFGVSGAGLRTGASGSFLARSGTWVRGAGVCGGKSRSFTATGASDVEASGGRGPEREMKRKRPSTRTCTRTEMNRESRSREVFMRVHERRVLVPQTEASRMRARQGTSSLDGFLAMFPGPNTHYVVNRQDENFAITDTSSMSCRHNGIDNIVHLLFRRKDFKFRLGQKIDHILGTPVQFRMSLLTSKALHLGYCQPLDANRVEALFDLVKFERLNNRLNLFHASSPPHLTPDTSCHAEARCRAR